MSYPGYGPPPQPFPPQMPMQSPMSPQFPMSPPPRRRAVPLTLWAAMVVILGLVIAVVVLGVGNVHNRVTSSDDVSAGDCVAVKNQDTDEVTVRRASCDRDKVTYYVASTSDSSITRCAGAAYDQVSLSDGGSLCLSPNLREGKCYEIGSRTAFTDRPCTAIAGESRTIVQVARRVAGDITPQCPSGTRGVGFALPTPVGYCLAPPSGIPA